METSHRATAKPGGVAAGSGTAAVSAARLFDGDQWLENHALLLAGERIAGVLPVARLAAGIPHLALGDCTLAPGLIDIQVNGGGGTLFNNAPDVAGVSRIVAGHRQFGTTGLVPTIISDTPEVQRAAARAVAEARAGGNAAVLGLHIEGPFFAPARRGTHKAGMIRSPAASDIRWLCARRDFPLVLTLAPEQAAPGQLRALTDAGLLVCAGHTDASYEQIRAAVAEGLRGFTHLFNAMSPLTARAPGAVGAALDSANTWAGIIADGHHVHPAAIRLAQRAMAPGRLMLVSDAMATVGGAGSFELYGETISVDGGRLVNAEGRLAGSAISLRDAVRYCHQEVGLALGECLRMASLYPAAFLGLDSQLGRLQAGYRADIVAFDSRFRVSDTWVSGHRRQHPQAAR